MTRITAISGRNHCADLLRLIGIFAVICLHATPFYHSGIAAPSALTDAVATAIDVVCRFAVPCFFLLSGRFMAISEQKTKDPDAVFRRFAGRIGRLFLLWCLIYALAPGIDDIRAAGYAGAVGQGLRQLAAQAASSPLAFLLRGTEHHLWFLPSLLLAAAVVNALSRAGLTRLLMPLGMGVFLAGWLAQYAHGFGFLDVALPTGEGPFMGLLFFAMGYTHEGTCDARAALAMAGFGLALQFIEAFGPYTLLGLPPADYYLGTVPFALGLFRFCEARPDVGSWLGLRDWSGVVLGVYLIHILVMRQALDPSPAIPWEAARECLHPVAILAVSLGLCEAMRRTPLRALLR